MVESLLSADLTQVVLDRKDVGVDVRLSQSFKGTYRDIRGYRSDARGVERSNIDSGEQSSSLLHWENVYNGCVELLKSGGLDFELMAWTCEALLRKDGFLGLAMGFELITEAIIKFKMDIFPSLEEGEEMEWKVHALTGLNGESSPGSLISPLYQVKIAEDSPIAIWAYQRSLELEQTQDKDQKQRMMAEGVVPLEEVNNALRQIDESSLSRQVASALRAIESFSVLEKVLYEQLSFNAPPSSRISESLSDCYKLLKKVYEQVFGRAPSVSISNCSLDANQNASDDNISINTEEDNIEVVGQPKLSLSLTINNRQQALQQLLLVSEYFKQHEPQSPLPGMIERVVNWAKLPWSDLMEKVLSDTSSLEHVFRLTGVNKEE